MSIVQVLIGSIVSSGSGGGGGGGQSYPPPGANYVAQGTSGIGLAGTAYDPGGAVDGIYAASSGWRRVTSTGTWSPGGSNDYPEVFNSEAQVDIDAYGGFGSTAGADYFSMEWKGYIKAGPGSYHTFYTDSDDVAMFWIGNAALNPTQGNAYVISNNGTTYPTNSLLLTEDKWYPVRMRFQEWSGSERCQVFYASEGGTAYGMLAYFNAGRLQFSGEWNGYGSTSSKILHLGSASTNVYSGAGDWLDSSPALNHAQFAGATAPTWLANDSGGVFELTGTNWFSIPTLPYYNEKAMSYSIWFNCTADNLASQDLIAEELTFKLRLNPGGVINVLVGPGYGNWPTNITTAITYTYGTWANITVTITDSGISVYKNGFNLGDYGGISAVGGTDNFPFNIGCHNGDGSDAFVGKIGEVKVYSYGLTAQQVEDDYTATVTRYNPPAPSGDITGSFVVEAVDNKGMLYGSLGSALDAVGIDLLQFSPDAGNTGFSLIDGTYSGYTIEANSPYRSAFYVSGTRVDSITVTIGGVSSTLTFVDGYSDLGDVFNLVARVGETLAISITFN